MRIKQFFAFAFAIMLIFSTLVGCSPDSENPNSKAQLPPPKKATATAIKGFPVEFDIPDRITSIVPLYNVYEVNDKEKINNFAEMLKSCSYEKREEQLELNVDYYNWIYSPMDIAFRYDNSEDYLHFSLFVEGYVRYNGDIYILYGLDRQIYCDTFGIEMPNTWR